MPGNTIKINNSGQLEWYVTDNKIDALINWLDNHSTRIHDEQDEDDIELSKMDLLYSWFNELIFPGKPEHFFQIINHIKDEKQEIKEFYFYTDNHRYHIYAKDIFGEDGYLECQVTTRKMRAGEDWIRGNDLPDGKFVKNTWNRIKDAIIRYEMVILSEHIKPYNLKEIDIIGD